MGNRYTGKRVNSYCAFFDHFRNEDIFNVKVTCTIMLINIISMLQQTCLYNISCQKSYWILQQPVATGGSLA